VLTRRNLAKEYYTLEMTSTTTVDASRTFGVLGVAARALDA